ncbi:MAG TPA: LysR family transcriptional regulator [Chromobacteriaceae bacterium]|nr:LysR family transcriptional regulator [Chromobacteriaceae bacterium]
MSISLRHVEIFRAVMTAGSVTDAAALLHTSQPTISRELARFEQLSGLVLFERRRGRLRPTAQALLLFEEVQRSYFGLERIVSTAQSIRQHEQGQLAIACLPAFSQSLLPTVCQPFLQRYPNVGISITPQESPLLEEWLAAQRHDLGLTESSHPPADTSASQLFCEDEVCVLPQDHPLAAHAVLQPQDFFGQPFISLSATDIYRQQVDELFARHGVQRRLVLETHSAASVCAMVRQGIGIAIVNPLSALDYAGQGLVMRRLSQSIPFTVQMIRPLHRPASPLVEHFVASLHQGVDTLRQRLRQQLDGQA